MKNTQPKKQHSALQLMLAFLREQKNRFSSSRGVKQTGMNGTALVLASLILAAPLAAYFLQEPLETALFFLTGFLHNGIFTLINMSVQSLAPYFFPAIAIGFAAAAAHLIYKASQDPTKLKITKAALMTTMAVLANIAVWGMIAGATAIPGPILFVALMGLGTIMGTIDIIKLVKDGKPLTFQEAATAGINVAFPALALTLIMLTMVTPAGPAPLLITLGTVSAVLLVARFVLKLKGDRDAMQQQPGDDEANELLLKEPPVTHHSMGPVYGNTADNGFGSANGHDRSDWIREQTGVRPPQARVEAVPAPAAATASSQKGHPVAGNPAEPLTNNEETRFAESRPEDVDTGSAQNGSGLKLYSSSNA